MQTMTKTKSMYLWVRGYKKGGGKGFIVVSIISFSLCIYVINTSDYK